MERNFHLLCPSIFNIGLNPDGGGDDCLGGGVVDVAIDKTDCLPDKCEPPPVFSVASNLLFE